MKTIRGIASLVLLLCAVVLAQTSDQSAETAKQSKQEKPETTNKKSKKIPGCAVANRRAGYALDIKLRKAAGRIAVYNVDYPEPVTQRHDPVCLSKKAGDSILWVSGSGRQFKLKIYPQQDPGKCGRHPFQAEPPVDPVYGHVSGPLKPDVPDNCMYNVEFPKEGEKTGDPHIRVTP
jgi:hypothetical protein